MSNVESLLIIVKNANLKHRPFTLLQLASSVLTTAPIFFEYTLPLRLMELFVCFCFNKDGDDSKNKLKLVEVRVLLKSSKVFYLRNLNVYRYKCSSTLISFLVFIQKQKDLP